MIIIALVVELVDAVDSKSTIFADVGVQVPPGAPSKVIMKCGIDLIEKSRISAIHNSRFREKFINRILTKSEQSRLKNDNHEYNISYLAKRWAAKEAVAKCLGCGIGGQISFLDIEISRNESGEPFAKIAKTDQRISISISDTKENAIAIAIL